VLLHANLGFVDRLIQMLDRFYAMAVIVMRSMLQMILGVAHGFQSSLNLRMWLGLLLLRVVPAPSVPLPR
jgi:hypothetical protein